MIGDIVPIKERFEINGIPFVRRYVDGVKIERDGQLYDVAEDLAELDLTYYETDIPRESDPEAVAESAPASKADAGTDITVADALETEGDKK